MSRGTQKNITFVIGSLLQGGAERVVSKLASKMAEQKYDVVILTYYETVSVYDVNPSVKIISVQKETGSRNLAKNIRFIRKVFKQRKGCIYSFIAVFNMVSIIAHIGLDSKLVVADRNDPRKIPRQFYLRLIRNILYHFSDAVVTQTNFNAQYFSKCSVKNVNVIYNPLELGDKFGYALTCKKDDLIVSVGRLVEQKNQKMLIEAFSNLGDDYSNFKLIIYGEGDYRNNLEQYIRELGLDDRISLPGNCQDVFEKISRATLFVLSSNFEGMPNALIEAMGLGLPVISTSVSGSTDMIQNGINGVLVPVGDTPALTAAMKEIISDYDLQVKYGNNAKDIRTLLNEESIMVKWLKVGNVLD